MTGDKVGLLVTRYSLRSMPLQRLLLPRVQQAAEQDGHKEHHLDQGIQTELIVSDSPGEDKDSRCFVLYAAESFGGIGYRRG